MGTRDWITIAQNGRNIAYQAKGSPDPSAKAVAALGEHIQAIGILAASEIKELQDQLDELRKKISKLEKTHGT